MPLEDSRGQLTCRDTAASDKATLCDETHLIQGREVEGGCVSACELSERSTESLVSGNVFVFHHFLHHN